MKGRFSTTRARIAFSALVVLLGCNRNVDTFGGILDTSNFDLFHSPDTDANNDGIFESKLPREGYVDGRVVQFYDFGAIPATFVADINGFVVKPNLLFRFIGETDLNGDGVIDSRDCDSSKAPPQVQTDPENGFDFDPRLNATPSSPFRQHELVDVLPDGTDINQDNIPDYNPVMEIVHIRMPKGFRCDEVLNVDTLRRRFASEDVNGDGFLELEEDIDLDTRIDDDLKGDLTPELTGQFVMIELLGTATRLPDMVASPVIDPDNVFGFNINFARFDPDGFSEDLDIDLNFDNVTEFDENGDGILNNEDIDGDGRLDVDEDANGNGLLDPGEDLDGDNRLDVNEDLDGNGVLTIEDLDGDGRRDCGENIFSPCTPEATNRAPITEDLNGNGILDPGEDGSTAEFGPPNGKLDTEDLNNNGVLDLTEDLNGNGTFDGILGGIPAYRDEFNVFFQTFLLHMVEFQPPTITEQVLTDAQGNPIGRPVKVLSTMRVFVDEANPDARPIFEFAPGEEGFQPAAQVFTYTRPAGFLPGQIKSVQELESLESQGLVTITATNLVIHAAFALDDPRVPGDAVNHFDTDGDGIPDFIELGLGLLGSDYISDPTAADTDGDGIPDGLEDLNANGLIEPGETDPTIPD